MKIRIHWTHEETAKAIGVKTNYHLSVTSGGWSKKGLEVAINAKHSRHGRKRKLDGEGQAHLVAVVCSPPPEGRKRWTLNLIRDQMVELEYVDSISRSTIHSELKKTN